MGFAWADFRDGKTLTYKFESENTMLHERYIHASKNNDKNRARRERRITESIYEQGIGKGSTVVCTHWDTGEVMRGTVTEVHIAYERIHTVYLDGNRVRTREMGSIARVA